MDHSDDDVVACCYRLLVIYPLYIDSNYNLYSYYSYSYNNNSCPVVNDV